MSYDYDYSAHGQAADCAHPPLSPVSVFLPSDHMRHPCVPLVVALRNTLVPVANFRVITLPVVTASPKGAPSGAPYACSTSSPRPSHPPPVPYEVIGSECAHVSKKRGGLLPRERARARERQKNERARTRERERERTLMGVAWTPRYGRRPSPSHTSYLALLGLIKCRNGG